MAASQAGPATASASPINVRFRAPTGPTSLALARAAPMSTSDIGM
jgi:hypothetical protein